METKALFQQIQQEISGEAIRSFAEQFRQFPLKLSFSSYAEGINFLAEQYRSFGLDADVIDFPADGKTVYADRHFPLAWDVDDAWAEIDGKRIADYHECSYCVVPFSHDSGGEQEAVIIPYDRLPETGSLEKIVPLAIPQICGPGLIAMLVTQSAKIYESVMALLIAWVVQMLILLGGKTISAKLGKKSLDALESLMGLLLTVVSVSMIIDSINQIYGIGPAK